jgi:tRNA G10  N-methylase Trm11
MYYLKITKKEALEAYEKLKDNNDKTLSSSKIGNTASGYFFNKERAEASYKSHKSPAQAWRENKEYIIQKAHQIERNKPIEEGIRTVLRLYYVAPSQFKPYVANFLIKKFKPKTILDPSAGWGDRLLAAMANDVNYIGIDTNKDLRKPYEEMIKFYPTKSKILMLFEPSENVNFSKFNYDMVFTSPPFENLERYKHMKEYDNFIEEFFIPVLKNSFKYLKEGGVMVLHLPEHMAKVFKSLNLFKKIHKIEYPKAKNSSDTPGRNTKEYIYWGRKPFLKT